MMNFFGGRTLYDLLRGGRSLGGLVRGGTPVGPSGYMPQNRLAGPYSGGAAQEPDPAPIGPKVFAEEPAYQYPVPTKVQAKEPPYEYPRRVVAEEPTYEYPDAVPMNVTSYGHDMRVKGPGGPYGLGGTGYINGKWVGSRR